MKEKDKKLGRAVYCTLVDGVGRRPMPMEPCQRPHFINTAQKHISVVGMTYCNANSPHHQSKTPPNTAFIQAMKPQPPTSGFNMIIISGGGGG